MKQGVTIGNAFKQELKAIDYAAKIASAYYRKVYEQTQFNIQLFIGKATKFLQRVN